MLVIYFGQRFEFVQDNKKGNNHTLLILKLLINVEYVAGKHHHKLKIFGVGWFYLIVDFMPFAVMLKREVYKVLSYCTFIISDNHRLTFTVIVVNQITKNDDS